jgi:putative transcriptional regulator
MVSLAVMVGRVKMSLKYKFDILARLKEAGYSTYRIRQEKIFGEAVLQQIRNNKPVSWENIEKLCALLGCQPGDIMEYVPDGER